jgi:hypothetical protein
MHRILLLICSLTCLFTAVHAADTTRRELKLGRAIKAMDKYYWSSNYTVEQKITARMNGAVVHSQNSKEIVSIAANCEVAAVTIEGEEREKLIMIRYFTVSNGDTTYDILQHGQIVRATFTDSGYIFLVDRAPAPDSIAQRLREIVHAEGGEKTGRILDAGRPVRVAESWPMNTAALRKVFLDSSITVADKDMKGTVTFDAIEEVDQRQAASVKATVDMKNVKIITPDLEAPQTATMRINIAYAVPLDVRYPPMRTSTSTNMEVTIKPPDRPGLTVTMQTAVTQLSSFQR